MQEDTALENIDLSAPVAATARPRKRTAAPTAADDLSADEVRSVSREKKRPGSKDLAAGMRRYTIVVPEEMVERVKHEVAPRWGLKVMETWEGLVLLGLEAFDAGRLPPMEEVPAAVRQLRRPE